MHPTRKIDLALEARELVQNSLRKTDTLPGVEAREETLYGLSLTRVEILDQTGEQTLGKPQGTYLTLTLPSLPQGRDEVNRTAQAVAEALSALPGLPGKGTVLVAGLGNRDMTPDALGPKTVASLFVTRHLAENLPDQFGDLRPVAAMAAGVTGTTGLETGELLRAVVRQVKPACLIAVDALAARRQERVCRTIQLSNTGIVPGSGVGNARMALNEDTLGIPVLAVGVPTVVDAATLCLDLLEDQEGFEPGLLRKEGAEWFVTPRNIDSEVASLARILGLGISAALHVDYSVENVESLIF